MKTATFSEFRNKAAKFFDAVEAGESIEVFRHGKPVALVMPYQAKDPGYWKSVRPLRLKKGVSLSEAVLSDRKESKY